ncbi:hypothetical protein IPJ72_03170 [Candidatus Peregrinibacteria bacterium]|nr:MAG: hypothetical protein IPJ72_03170 [Candidatus Peregrinibacteria bacterium]
MIKLKHKDLAAGRWQTLGLIDQLAHIGSEVGRTAKWQNVDQERADQAFERALELFYLIIADPRWKKRLKEIVRAKELFCGAYLNHPQFNTTLQDLDRYFMQFALMRNSRR